MLAAVNRAVSWWKPAASPSRSDGGLVESLRERRICSKLQLVEVPEALHVSVEFIVFFEVRADLGEDPQPLVEADGGFVLEEAEEGVEQGVLGHVSSSHLCEQSVPRGRFSDRSTAISCSPSAARLARLRVARRGLMRVLSATARARG